MSTPEPVLDLSVIIVSFNTRELLRNCLSSIFSSITGIAFEVIVVDNASLDGSPEMVRESFPEVLLIESGTNAGFARANNLAMREARGRYFLLLNSDTVMQTSPHPVLDFLDKGQDIGLLGCRIVYGDGSLQKSAWRFPALTQEWYYFSFEIIRSFIPALSNLRYRGIHYNSISDADCVSGCSLFIRSELFRLIGGLDERFFMYYEDTEYGFRARMQTRYRTVYYPHYEIVHYHGKSSNDLKATLRSFRSAVYYFSKIKGRGRISFFVGACKASWRFNLAVLSMIGLFLRSNKVADKVDTFKQLLSSARLLGKGKVESDYAEAEKIPATGCKSS